MIPKGHKLNDQSLDHQPLHQWHLIAGLQVPFPPLVLFSFAVIFQSGTCVTCAPPSQSVERVFLKYIWREAPSSCEFLLLTVSSVYFISSNPTRKDIRGLDRVFVIWLVVSMDVFDWSIRKVDVFDWQIRIMDVFYRFKGFIEWTNYLNIFVFLPVCSNSCQDGFYDLPTNSW